MESTPRTYTLSYERQKEAQVLGDGVSMPEPEEMSHLSSCGVFCSYSYRDVCRNKCTFCLSLLSVLFVVWSTLVINTMVDKGPIIFLKLAEAQTGEMDAMIQPSINEMGYFLNYTQI